MPEPRHNSVGAANCPSECVPVSPINLHLLPRLRLANKKAPVPGAKEGGVARKKVLKVQEPDQNFGTRLKIQAAENVFWKSPLTTGELETERAAEVKKIAGVTEMLSVGPWNFVPHSQTEVAVVGCGCFLASMETLRQLGWPKVAWPTAMPAIVALGKNTSFHF